MILKDLIKIYDDFASHDWCTNLVHSVQSKKLNHHKTDGYEFEQISLSSDPQLKTYSAQFVDAFCDIAKEYFQEFGMYEFVEHTKLACVEDVRLKKYTKNSKMGFNEHVDVVDMESASRYLTGLLYLNDNDGFTEFRGIKVKPKIGSLIVFPPMWMFPHKALTPTDNDKYVVMTSLRY